MTIAKILGRLTAFDKIWFCSFAVIILAATVYFSATGTDWADPWAIVLNCIVAPLSALTGIITVMLCAKGNIYNYLFGVINAATYGIIAWVSGYYGDWLLNWFFFIPTQFFILLVWRKHLRRDNPLIVRMKKLTWIQIVLLALGGAAALAGFGLLLSGIDHWFVNYWKRSESIYATVAAWSGISLLGPLIDSSTEVLQVFGQILCVRRYAEQWIFWILTNLLTIVMWLAVVLADPASMAWALPTLVMWCAFLVNSVYGAVVWFREAEKPGHGASPVAANAGGA